MEVERSILSKYDEEIEGAKVEEGFRLGMSKLLSNYAGKFCLKLKYNYLFRRGSQSARRRKKKISNSQQAARKRTLRVFKHFYFDTGYRLLHRGRIKQ